MENTQITNKCNCIEQVEKLIRERKYEELKEDDSISDISASMDTLINLTKGELFTYSNVKTAYLKNGKWKKQVVPVNHSFCPFCGAKHQ